MDESTLPALADHAFIALVAVALPLWSAWSDSSEAREALRASAAERIRAYWRTTALQWIATLIVIAIWLSGGRPMEAMGLSLSSDWRLFAGLGLAALFITALAVHQRRALLKPGGLHSTRAMLERMAPFLPRARKEYPHFAITAITAGVCEEIIYRGYLFWYLSSFVGTAWWSWGLIVLIAAVIFAVAHLYQGAGGVVQVFAMAIFFGGLYLFSGSLIPCIILHTAADLNGGWLAVKVHGALDNEGRDDDEDERGNVRGDSTEPS